METAWAALLLGCLLLGWLWHARVVGRQIRLLARTASRIGGGNLAARASLHRSARRDLTELAGALNAMADNLARREAEIAAAQTTLAQHEADLRIIAENTSDIIVRLDANFQRIYVSPAVQAVLGYLPAEYRQLDLSADVHPEDAERLLTMLDRLRHGAPTISVTYRRRRRDRRYVWLEVVWQRVAGEAESALQEGGIQEFGTQQEAGAQKPGYVAVMRDITRRRRAEEWATVANRRLHTLAMQDGLTGLANRRSFDATLQREEARARRNGTTLGMLLLDVDNFKSFNDALGHLAGDEALRQVAALLQRSLRRPGDFAARFGGEEIAIILPDTDTQGALRVAEQLRAAIQALDIVHPASPHGVLTVSIGATSTRTLQEPLVGIDLLRPDKLPARLIASADAALYAAKRAGRNRCRADTPEIAALEDALAPDSLAAIMVARPNNVLPLRRAGHA